MTTKGWFPKLSKLLAVAVLGAAFFPGPAPAGAQDSLPAWGTVPSPNAGFSPNRLNAVAVLSPTDVWAAGSFGGLLSPEPMVQHWDGISWSLVPVPQGTGQGELFGIAAVASNDVWFVGGYQIGGNSLILHWDGASLSVVPNPNPGTFNRLYAVTAVSADDVWAVGEYTDPISKTLVEHWDGTSWSVVPSPTRRGQYTQLLGVSAISATDIWAVGKAGNDTIALHWDGVRWQRVRTPSPGFSASLKAVSGVASNDVWAVGGSDNQSTLAFHWDGAAWSVVPSPNPGGFYNQLNGVVALAPNDVWAVGYYDGNWLTLALHWDGAAWSVVPSPSPNPTLNAFYGVVADATDEVWAVGEMGYDVDENLTLVEQWNGAAWNVVPSANAGTGSNQLNDLSALATDDIWAVGEASGNSLTLHWDGAFWSIVPSPDVEFGVPLEGVVAIGPNDVWAVGSTGDPGSLDSSTVTMHWDGVSWTIVPSPNPGRNSVDRLYAIDGLASNDLWAVGEYWNQNQVPEPLIMHWNGARWALAPNSCAGGLSGITVLAANDIWAVGDAVTCHYDGSFWTLVESPQPGYPEIAYPLEDVSGASTDDVWAVGAVVYDEGKYLSHESLIEHWDGIQWTADYNQPGVTLSGVEALSADDVWAVGTNSVGTLTLILHWDGSAWSTVPSPDPGSGGELKGVDAVAADDLWAVGVFYDELDPSRTLVVQAPSDTQGAVVGDTNVSGAVVSWFGPTSGSTETDVGGEYAAAGLPAGNYLFTAAYGGCTPDSANVTVIAGTTVLQDFQINC